MKGMLSPHLVKQHLFPIIIELSYLRNTVPRASDHGLIKLNCFYIILIDLGLARKINVFNLCQNY